MHASVRAFCVRIYLGLAILTTLHISAICGKKALSVYFADDTGETRSFPRNVRATSPLSDLIEAFFDGPSPLEQKLGARPFQYGCVSADHPDAPERSNCDYKDIVRKVWVQDDKAYIEVRAYPNASASGIWDTLDRPLTKIVQQFPHLKSWGFSMQGYDVLGGDFGSPCGNRVCFLFSDIGPSHPEVEETLATFGLKRLKANCACVPLGSTGQITPYLIKPTGRRKTTRRHSIG